MIFALVLPLVEAVKDAMKWQEESSSPKKQQKYYPYLKKSLPSFPFITEIKEVIDDEWAMSGRSLRKSSMSISIEAVPLGTLHLMWMLHYVDSPTTLHFRWRIKSLLGIL